MKKLMLLVPTLFCYTLHSQYYYKDIIATADLSRLMKSYVDNSVRKVTATGITPEGAPSKDFSETYEVLNNGTALKITTRINQVTSSLLHRFNEKGLLLSTIDSASGIKNTISYNYDVNGRITSITNSSVDISKKAEFTQTEAHIFSYENGHLKNMWRIINNTDSLQVEFVYDNNNNLIEEWNVKRGVFSDPFDYYYDDKNRLTDIVRFNNKANRAIPDFIFLYDENNRIIQKITTSSGQSIGYFIWRYAFNEKGLKSKEAMYNKDKVLLGRIDYTYN